MNTIAIALLIGAGFVTSIVIYALHLAERDVRELEEEIRRLEGELRQARL